MDDDKNNKQQTRRAEQRKRYGPTNRRGAGSDRRKYAHVYRALPAEVAPQQKTPLTKEFFVKNIVRMVFGGKKNI